MTEVRTLEDVKSDLSDNIESIARGVNEALGGGKGLERYKNSLERLGRGGNLPHWYDNLCSDGTLPNLDGKSLGSVIEMIFVAVLEKRYENTPFSKLAINPARGVDIPTIKLGVKSPSENYCTSEPYLSAYDRLIGNEYDSVILLTDYQTAKENPPLKIQLKKAVFIQGSQIADKKLCSIAKKQREILRKTNETELKKLVRFLAYVIRSDWEAKKLLKVVTGKLDDESIRGKLEKVIKELEKDDENSRRAGKELRHTDLIDKLGKINPDLISLVNAADNWVVEKWDEFARCPNRNEWERFLRSDLDGKITMSYALQWRYSFRNVFSTVQAL